MRQKSEKLTNAYISIEVDESMLEALYDRIKVLLDVLEIPYEISPRPHVSIAYTLGQKTLGEIEEIISEIAEAPFIIEGNGLCIIPGQVIPKDFISLQIRDNDDFLYAQEFVAENMPTKTTFDGKHFIAHISLFQIEKGLDSVHHDLARVLEMNLLDLGPIKLKGTSISVFNSERELIIKKSL
jgi:hypothetical protein